MTIIGTPKTPRTLHKSPPSTATNAHVFESKRQSGTTTASLWIELTSDCKQKQPLQQRVEYKVSLLIYKCLHQATPSCLAEMYVPVSATDNRCHLRSAIHGDLAVPRLRLARQDTEEVSLCLIRCCGTHYHWLSVMRHWHWLSSVDDCRLFCFTSSAPTWHLWL